MNTHELRFTDEDIVNAIDEVKKKHFNEYTADFFFEELLRELNIKINE